MSLFSAVEMAPRDPILGLNEQYNADTNPNKVNLGVGVYFDDNGKLPLLQCVQAFEKTMMDKPTARGYLPIDGIAAYDAASRTWCLVPRASRSSPGACATVQGHGRHRRPQGRRRLPEKAQPQRQGADQLTPAGKTTAPCSPTPALWWKLPLLRRRHARRRTLTACWPT
jgi:hypothetical protein